MSGILSGSVIKNAVNDQDIEIDPYVPDNINPASVDLRLGDLYRKYNSDVLDSRKDNPTSIHRIGEDGVTLYPGQFYLMHTMERVHTKHFVPVLDGKSSIGRLGIQIHLTAGFGDPGFNGQYTMEVIVARPVIVYAGMRFAQIRFHTIQGATDLYEGNYLSENAMGPVSSRAWRQFERGLLYSCYWCKKDAPKSEWGPGRITCPNCKRQQPSVAEREVLEARDRTA